MSLKDDGVRAAAVTRRYGGRAVLDGMELNVPRHGRVGVVGPSGCGKSTLLRLLAGLEEPDAGHLTVFGRREARQRLANCVLMPQKDLLLPWRNVLDNAGLALENRGVPRRRARQRVAPLLGRFGLADFERHWPAQLSGGMRQRVAFLRTLVADKDVLLLDEPFGALDSLTRADLQDWLHEALVAEPRTVILVTHDVEEALLLCHEVVVMTPRPGRVAARVPVDLPAAGSRRVAVGGAEFIRLREHVMTVLERG